MNKLFQFLIIEKNKHCSRLSDSHFDAILRLYYKKQADIEKLASQMQPLKSHWFYNFFVVTTINVVKYTISVLFLKLKYLYTNIVSIL